MAETLAPSAPLIAETGGLNAMIVDSTALPEQVVRDVVTSAFQSAGQRCSALRILYLQDDIAEGLLTMLFGAMDELSFGEPWDPATDIGPVIDETAKAGITRHIDAARAENRVLKQLAAPAAGSFVGPTVIKVRGIEDLAEEIFGPVLHVATFDAERLDDVIQAINGKGYGLTFGLHTRIDDRVQALVEALRIGNIYVNRNQIGAIVGSQPFGGEGLSGTGPKAGGPCYVQRFKQDALVPDLTAPDNADAAARAISLEELQAALAKLPAPAGHHLGEPIVLPGPTGESNRLTLHPRAPILCLGPTSKAALEQLRLVRRAGCLGLAAAPGADDGLNGRLDLELLAEVEGIGGVVLWGAPSLASMARQALARRQGPILPLITDADVGRHCMVERHLCIDTTAAGGNTSLLARAVD
jgi:RHH-type proline utilization regulon transcriptional repressor/proline dehydrogenase/delta 1-pyrroline-5-carboxylate dehydrogenase